MSFIGVSLLLFALVNTVAFNLTLILINGAFSCIACNGFHALDLLLLELNFILLLNKILIGIQRDFIELTLA